MSWPNPVQPHRDALARLCTAYWYPLYAFIRRRGHAPHEAQDLTQDFFLFLLEGNVLEHVQRERGKFRTFLLRALTNFLNNAWDKRCTLKRGGQFSLVSWEATAAENLYGQEPVSEETPEKLFDRRWATALVEQVIEQLRQDYARGGRAELFGALQNYLTGETAPGSYSGAAARLGMNEGAVKVALHRMRRRFGELLREEIAQTVSSPAEADEEIRHLFAALA